MRLPKPIRSILSGEGPNLTEFSILLNFYKQNKNQLSTRQKRVIYNKVEQIRWYYNSERVEQVELTRNDDSKQTITIYHKSIDLKIEEIRPDDIYKDDFRRISFLDHLQNKLVKIWNTIPFTNRATITDRVPGY